MTIVESIRNYIGSLDCLSTLAQQINVNYVDDNNFSIEEIPVQPIVRQYVDGSSIRQVQFSFTGSNAYSSEVLQNISNSGFYEEFSNEIEDKNLNNILPIMANGLTSLSLKVISTPYILAVTEDTAYYKIDLRLEYRKE